MSYFESLWRVNLGVMIWSNVTGCPPQDVRLGDQVALGYDDVTDAVTLAKFRRKAS